ncbi:MAG TPA: hypothetical protein G4O18_02595 [Dehalococcoidia bacterium]|nr:hypothetical protein [Dehalococcoidia bacterium]
MIGHNSVVDKPRVTTGRLASVRNGRVKAEHGEAEEYFWSALMEPLSLAAEIGEADIVVGVPFYNEFDTIGHVLRTIRRGLLKYYPSKKCVIVAVGSPAGKEALKVAKAVSHGEGIAQMAFLLDQERISGKGWAVWAIMQVARTLGADLAIIEADVKSRRRDGQTLGLVPEWISLLLDPIETREMDLVVSRFARHYLEDTISSHVFYPLLAAVFDCPVHDLGGGQWGISYRLLRAFLQRAPLPPNTEVGGFGIDAWLVTSAIGYEGRICEANLGIKVHQPSVAKAQLVLTQAARVLFEQAFIGYQHWTRTTEANEPPLVQPLPVFGVRSKNLPDEVNLVPQQLVHRYQQGFGRFRTLFEQVMPKEAFAQLEALSEADARSFSFTHRLWVQAVYRLVLAGAFASGFATGDIVNTLVVVYCGHLASFALETQAVRERLKTLPDEEAEHLVSLEAERKVELMVDEFIRQRPEFMRTWELRHEALKPIVPNVTYREFIPGVPLVVPSELNTPDGGTATANGVYEGIFNNYKQQFERFVYERLNVPRGAGSHEIAERIKEFLLQVEGELGDTILTSDLSSVEGTRQAVDVILHYFGRWDVLAIDPEMSSWLLWRTPPTYLITRMGYSYLNELLADYESNDILALASWVEEHDYKEQVGALIKESIRPEHFVRTKLKPLVMNLDEFPSLAEMKETPSLSRIAGRMVLGNLHKGMGGELPRLRYLTTVAKNAIEAERWSEVWHRFAEEKKDFAEKVINALEGHWGKVPLSAHNFFENGHQRVFVERLREMAWTVVKDNPEDEVRKNLAEHLDDIADSYHLALTLPDGTFIPCSVWTWASYSSKGGTGVPTPLSLHVERDWSSRDFITAYYTAAGGDEAEIDNKVTELMANGREYEDLALLLFEGAHEAKGVVRQTYPSEEQPPAQNLLRFTGNPVLAPIPRNKWESKYLLNPGAIRLNGRVNLVYRAVGGDEISRLGLASSEDGFHFTERLSEPIFEPRTPSEKKGCEDPRLTRIGDRVYMTYTAYSIPVAQIAIASISIEDFANHHWRAWHRHGLVFPGFTDKDAALFPELFEDKFAMLHRVDPHIWITFSTHMRCPWSRKEHTILAGSRSGMVWDSLKIGGGSPPLKTEYGWLLITHGVNHDHTYRLGVMLLDLADPTILIYRSPNAILEPAETFEVGGEDSWVPNVVFTCGAVPREEGKDILGAEDEILVYYGAADSLICVATARVKDFIPGVTAVK